MSALELSKVVTGWSGLRHSVFYLPVASAGLVDRVDTNSFD